MLTDINTLTSSLPPADAEILPGVKWGRCEELFTPAYWKVQYYFHKDDFCKDYYCVGSSLLDEICACILGGYGMPAEMGFAAYDRLKNFGLLVKGAEHALIESALSFPFCMDDRMVRYRFPRQKAKFIFELLSRSDLDTIPQYNDLELRNWLLTVSGIGLKTASWIVRNWLCSDRVAILDIHIYRAGLIAGFFAKSDTIEKDYLKMEEQYLAFAKALEVSPANLDSLIWLQLKMANTLALNILKQAN
jgi:N-glycosylase/DNA lyase